jgi:hypothetical protein
MVPSLIFLPSLPSVRETFCALQALSQCRTILCSARDRTSSRVLNSIGFDLAVEAGPRVRLRLLARGVLGGKNLVAKSRGRFLFV